MKLYNNIKHCIAAVHDVQVSIMLYNNNNVVINFVV